VTELLRSLATTLALAAMLLRGLLPAGWMPNRDALAGAPLVICGGFQDLQQGRAPGHAPHGNSGKVCPFAAVAHLAAPQLPVIIVQTPVVAWLSPAPAAYVRHALRRTRAHSPRAPPIPV
jgi:hypothetical protein